jgi:hypothetical protein
MAVTYNTSGRYTVPVKVTLTFDGDEVGIRDDSGGEAIGNACEAIHERWVKVLGARVTKSERTDAYERRPVNKHKVLARVKQEA